MEDLASRAALRRWLDGRWALYFSHPQDFVRTDFEADRWLVLLEDAFEHAAVRPVAPEGAVTPAAGGWIRSLGGAPVRLPRLHRGSGRFVAAFDASLRLRRRFSYATALSAPSPLDIAAAIAVQRRLESRQRGRSLVIPLAAAAMATLYFSRRAIGARSRTAPHC